MIALTGDFYGQSDRWTDKDIYCATIVFEADSHEGPFLEIKDNLLLTSSTNKGQGISARTVERNGERLLFYTHSEISTGRGRLSWPEKLVPRPQGGLDPVYWEGVNDAFIAPVDAPATDVTSDQSGYKLIKVGQWNRKDSTYMITATANLRTAQAGGIALGRKDATTPFLLAQIDCAAKPDGLVPNKRLADTQIIKARETHIVSKGIYNLRVVVCGEIIKFYVDEKLILSQYAAGIKPGDVYLYARQGEARYQNLKYYAPKTTR